MSSISVFYLLFLILVALGYYNLPQKLRPVWLLVGCYLFYLTWQPAFLLILIFVTLAAFLTGKRIASTPDTSHKKRWLFGGIAVLLLPLFTFKYLNPINDGVSGLLAYFTIEFSFPNQPYIAPLGISFFTFVAVGYVVDVYREYIEPEHRLHRFAAFLAFFPTILAGPIERAKSLLKQINNPVSFEYENVRAGLQLILWGVFKKVVLADRIREFSNQVYAQPDNFPGLVVYFAMVSGLLWVFCDFSAYSDIAVGTARVLGIKVRKNFDDRVYASTSLQQLWQGWHISLTSWLRDYVFFPLSKNVNNRIRLHVNLIFVFFLIGLWHAPVWGYVVWGILNGSWVVLENVTKDRRHSLLSKAGIALNGKFYSFVSWLLTFHVWAVFGVFFGDDSPKKVVQIFSGLANANTNLLSRPEARSIAVTLVLLIFMHLINRKIPKNENFDAFIGKQHFVVRWILYVILIQLILRYIYQFGNTGFLYFNF